MLMPASHYCDSGVAARAAPSLGAQASGPPRWFANAPTLNRSVCAKYRSRIYLSSRSRQRRVLSAQSSA